MFTSAALGSRRERKAGRYIYIDEVEEERRREEEGRVYIYIPVLNHAVTRMNAHSSLKQSYILNDNNLFESYHPVYNDLWFVWVTF